MQTRPNIIFLMTDQHRLDHASYHGKGKLATPNIDRIAESVGFTSCTTVNPVCMPARSCLMTGKYSHQIGALAMSGDLNPQHPTYARALQRAGYYTASVGKLHWFQGWPWKYEFGKGHHSQELEELIKSYGFDDVWEASGKQLTLRNHCHYADYMAGHGLLDAYREFVSNSGANYNLAVKQDFTGEPWPFEERHYPDIVIGDKLLEQLDSRPKDQPFYLFGSFLSPHPPYDPPQSYLDRVPYEEEDDFLGPEGRSLPEAVKKQLYMLRRAYKAMVLVVDDQIGRLLDKLEQDGLLDNTVILFGCDHGEMMGDHGRAQKMCARDSSLTVPAAIRHPDYLHKAIVDTPVELIDLTATILDLAGLDPQRELSMRWPEFHNIVPCRSLLPLVTGEKAAVRDYAFSEWGARWEVMQSDRFKYIRYFNQTDGPERYEELFDRRTDRAELHNLSGDPQYAEALAEHREALYRLKDATPPAQLRHAPLIKEYTL